MLNNTIAANRSDSSGGAISIGHDCTIEVYNTIIDLNASPDGKEILVGWEGDPSELIMDTSCLPGGTGTISVVSGGTVDLGEWMVYSPPGFVNGAMGAYYLSNPESGDPEASPCIDAGNDASGNICFSSGEETRCLSEYTTRTDGVVDAGMVDIGYHYPLDGFICLHTGDVDLNDEITPNDALETFRIYLGMSQPSVSDYCLADCDGNSEVTPLDALCILRNYLDGSCECVNGI
jgi:hypothetical protein